MRVVDQDTGKDLFLDKTPEMTADLAPIYEACPHPEKELRQRKNKGGVTQYIDQCLRCGDSVGVFLKHSAKLETVPLWNEDLEKSFATTREHERVAIIQKHVRIQRGRTEGFWKDYKAYLNSADWQQKRTKVLERAKGQCEGCWTKVATQIHHLTYSHVFAEFLFELVAVCDDCHGRLHSSDTNDVEDQNERTLDELVADLERNVHPCDGCRHASGEAGKHWCFIFEAPAEVARSSSGECGPQRNGYEPLH